MISIELQNRLKKIKLAIFDVDGIMTDARIFYDSQNGWTRLFNVRDGWGIVKIQELGYQTGVITGAFSEDVRRRIQFLKFNHFFENQKYKEEAFTAMLKTAGVSADEVAYMGDDWPDIPLLKQAGFAATVPDAMPEVKDVAMWISNRPGGHGAARELCDLLIQYGALSPLPTVPVRQL